MFTPRFTCDFEEAPPLVEVLPPLVPLAGALSARQWEEHQAALAAAAAEEKAVQDAKAAEEAAVRFPCLSLAPPLSKPRPSLPHSLPTIQPSQASSMWVRRVTLEVGAGGATHQRLAEEARVAEYMAAVPDEVVAAVQKVFDEKIVGVRADMATQFQAQEDALLAKISALEKVAAGGAAAGTPKSGTPK